MSSECTQAVREKQQKADRLGVLDGPFPAGTPEVIGSTATGIMNFVKKELEKDNPPWYILFTNVPPKIIQSSDDSHFVCFKGARIC